MTGEEQIAKVPGKGIAHPYLAMMGLYLGGFTGMYSETALNIALPQLSEAFGATMAVTQWLVVGYMLVIGIVLPFASILMKWFSVFERFYPFTYGYFDFVSLIYYLSVTVIFLFLTVRVFEKRRWE